MLVAKKPVLLLTCLSMISGTLQMAHAESAKPPQTMVNNLDDFQLRFQLDLIGFKTRLRAQIAQNAFLLEDQGISIVTQDGVGSAMRLNLSIASSQNVSAAISGGAGGMIVGGILATVTATSAGRFEGEAYYTSHMVAGAVVSGSAGTIGSSANVLGYQTDIAFESGLTTFPEYVLKERCKKVADSLAVFFNLNYEANVKLSNLIFEKLTVPRSKDEKPVEVDALQLMHDHQMISERDFQTAMKMRESLQANRKEDLSLKRIVDALSVTMQLMQAQVDALSANIQTNEQNTVVQNMSKAIARSKILIGQAALANSNENQNL